ncbi:class I SAM-dependent methyltransferase [Aliidongia dinghuensis]|uniref:class I SAM-dependent methyltransferase n=1 Tax=Aliidongia dinghuensis TaxID=1867774 RepID=UPI001668CA25|nr:class I SAM-dependent methyltransferase [Aliidongia dinghuensis]
MKNRDQWKESKFVFRKGRLVASSDPGEVSLSSRLIATIVAGRYQDAFPVHGTGRLLDLGCGKVPLYAAYKEYVTEIICVDWENTLHGGEYLDRQVDLSNPLPFADGEFDTIILSDVLEHISAPDNLWNEIVRILAVGGKIIMNVPFYYCLHEQPHDYYRYTEFALRRFVANSNMTLISLEPIGGAPEILADVASKVATRIPKVGRLVARLIQFLGLWFVKTKLGRRISSATAADFPFGYFMIAQKS